MNEKTLLLKMVKQLNKDLPNATIFKHADRVTAGIPDVSVTWKRMTTWLEVKYANPDLHDRGMQNLVMKQLALSGSAWYVIYDQVQEQTIIVRPGELEDGMWRKLLQCHAPGFDHKLVSWFVRRLHEKGSLSL